MRITEASERLGISARMLRYRESLGLLPPVRETPGPSPAQYRRLPGTRPAEPRQHASLDGAQPGSARYSRANHSARQDSPGTASATGSASTAAVGALANGRPARHRQFDAADLDAVAFGLAIEQRYDVNPAALAFALRVLADPAARAEVAELGRRIGRIRPLPAMALDFEKERALRMLGASPPGRTAKPARSART